MEQTSFLTKPHDELTQKRFKDSHAGMAHWAGTGPEGKTCRECQFAFDFKRYGKSNKTLPGRLQNARCRKFQSMTGKQGRKLDPNTASCRFFEEHPNPPALVESEWRG